MWAKLAKMSVREAMIELVGKPGYGEQPTWFEKVADAANISKRNARSLWRGEIRSDKHRAAIAVRRAVEQARLDEARRDARKVADYFDRYAEALAVTDEEFHRDSIDAFREVARVISGRDRT